MRTIVQVWRPQSTYPCVMCNANVIAYVYMQGVLHGGKLPCGCCISGDLTPEEIALAILMMEG